MMRRNLLFANLLLSVAIFAQTQSVFNYDFNNLVVGNLNGQDSWVTTKFTNTTLDYKVALTASPDSLSNGLTYAGSGANVGVSASRMIDTIFGGTVFNDLTASYTIKYQLKRNYWGLSFGIAADINNDGKVDKNSTNEKALVFTGISNTALGGDKFLLPNGSNTVYAGALTNVWSDVEIQITDLTTGGLLSLRVKPITSSTWTNVVQSVAMGIDTNAASNKNPHNWNMLYMHNEGANGTIDNIQIIKSTPLPTSINERVKSDVLVFPNPSTHYIQISGEHLSTISLFDLQGNKVSCEITPNEKGARIQTDLLRDGVYIVCIASANGNSYQRILVQK
jgi:hypothetical protein